MKTLGNLILVGLRGVELSIVAGMTAKAAVYFFIPRAVKPRPSGRGYKAQYNTKFQYNI